jgi:hypothetical protein
MSASNLIDLFSEFGIKNAKQLEAVLEREGAGGNWSSEGIGGYRPESFGLRVAEILNESSQKDKLDDRGYGIQHYTYIGSERILEESLKKGLFISRRINFITDHDFVMHSSDVDYDVDSAIGYVYTYDWRFSPDFVRDVFKYQDLIRSGKLQLLPAKITFSRTTGTHTAGPKDTVSTYNVELDVHKDVRDLAVSNALTSLRNKRLVERILGHYRQNNQLANTMQMDIPWIAGIKLKALNQYVSDNQESIDSFQKAYHRALEETIINYRDLNFARLTLQINKDIIQPELTRIARKYKRSLSLHRSLLFGGAFVASMPVTVALVGHIAFNQTLQTSEIAGLISGFASGLVASLASNTIHHQNAKAELQEEKFYALWKLSNK